MNPSNQLHFKVVMSPFSTNQIFYNSVVQHRLCRKENQSIHSVLDDTTFIYVVLDHYQFVPGLTGLLAMKLAT
jgi:hypothetical protein